MQIRVICFQPLFAFLRCATELAILRVHHKLSAWRFLADSFTVKHSMFDAEKISPQEVKCRLSVYQYQQPMVWGNYLPPQ